MEENKNFHGEEEQLRMELPEAIAQEVPTAEASPEEEILPPAAEGEQFSIRIPEPPLRKKKGKAHYIWTTLFILMNVAVLLFTAISDFGGSKEPPDSLTAIGVISKNWYYIIFAVIAFAVGILLEVGKLSFMTKRTTGKGRFKLCVQTVLLGKYYDNITPLASGGQPFQIYHLSKNGVETGKATSVIISSFFLNQLTFIILCLAAVILDATGVLSCSAEIFQEGSAMRTNFQILRIFSYIGIALGSFLPLTVLLFFAFPRTSLGMLQGGIKVLHKLHLVKNPALTNMKVFRTIVQSSRSIKQIAELLDAVFKRSLLRRAELRGLLGDVFHAALFRLRYPRERNQRVAPDLSASPLYFLRGLPRPHARHFRRGGSDVLRRLQRADSRPGALLYGDDHLALSELLFLHHHRASDPALSFGEKEETLRLTVR